jgi:WS/DGAT/MGAT family acyltransferase
VHVRQLTATDNGFLAMEAGPQTGHVGSLSIYGPEATYEASRAYVLERMGLLTPFRRRLVQVPMDLDYGYWIEDPDFDIEYHIRQIALPRPGNQRQLEEQVARLHARPLDRSKPLWEWYVIEGLESGDIAHYTKTHHATIDGMSGMDLTSTLLEETPDPAPPTAPPPPAPERIPSGAELLGRSLLNLATSPQRMARAQRRLLRETAKATRSGALRTLTEQLTATPPGPLGDLLRRLNRSEELPEARAPLPLAGAPRTPFNAPITPHRRWTYVTLSLSDTKRVKAHYGVTVNDVVLALCAAALRRWLVEHDALPTAPLVASCPVSIRTGDEEEQFSNRISFMLTTLATDEPDPARRLQTIHESTVAAKAQMNLLPADVLQDFSQFAPPALAVQASRLLVRYSWAQRFNLPYNVAISNVPGPRMPLYMAGAELKHMYPVSMITNGMGLNMTVTSYRDGLDFGLISCRELIPDLHRLGDHLSDALDELVATI